MKASGQMNTPHMGTLMKLALWKIHLRCVVPRLWIWKTGVNSMHRKSSRQFLSRLFCCSHFETLKSALFQAFLLQSESEKALTDAEKALTDAAPVGRPPNIPRASLAFVGEGNFVLDAEPQDLAWSPKTISVVTWPQFYRSYIYIYFLLFMRKEKTHGSFLFDFFQSSLEPPWAK